MSLSAEQPTRGQAGAILLRLSVSGVLLVLVLRAVPVSQIADSVASFGVIWMVPILGLHLVGVLIRSAKLHYLSAASGTPISFRSLVRIYFLGSLAYAFVPSLEVAQVGLIGNESGRYARAALSVSMDRLSGLVALLAIGAVALGLRPDLVHSLHPVTPVLVGASLVLTLLMLFAGFSAGLRESLWRITPLALRDGSGWASQGLRSFHDGLRLLGERRARIPVLLGLALLFQSSGLIIYFLMCQGLELSVAPSALASVFPLMGLANLFPSILGIGSRDAGFVLALGQIGIQPAAAITLSVLHLGLVLYSAAIGAILLLLRTAKLRPSREPR